MVLACFTLSTLFHSLVHRLGSFVIRLGICFPLSFAFGISCICFGLTRLHHIGSICIPLGSFVSYWEFLHLGIRVVSSSSFEVIFVAPHWLLLRSAYLCIGSFGYIRFVSALALSALGARLLFGSVFSDDLYIIVVALGISFSPSCRCLRLGSVCCRRRSLMQTWP
jgi:hypothetical protein